DGHPSRDRFWGRGASGRAGARTPRDRVHRLRGLPQRPRQADRGDRGGRPAKHPPLGWRRSRSSAPPRGGLDRRGRSPVSGSLAEAPSAQAPDRLGPVSRRAVPRDAPGRRIPLRDRYRRLRRLGSGARPSLAKLRLGGGPSRRLARTLGRLARHALRGQGAARGAPAELSHVSAHREHGPAQAEPAL
ncbi:MAG: tRNA (guanine(46)-N(7))-methyltransferase, partial [uncultured Microvirga sp.]